MKHFIYLLLLLSVCFIGAQRIEAAKFVEPDETVTLDFIYVNANTGEAAGGHTAIRLGSTVFHYQFFPDGKFLLVRESWSHFRYLYNELRNRTISVSRVPLTARGYAQLRNHFTGLLLAQQQNLKHLHAAQDERDLLTQLKSDTGKLALESVGLFDYSSAEDDSMRNLNQVIHRALGENFMIHQRKQVDTRLARHTLKTDQPVDGLTWIARLQALLLEREFYRIIEQGMSLAPERIFSTSLGAVGLSTEQHAFLQSYSQQLVASIVGLVQSQRPDRARSILLQTARYLVVRQSLATNTLLTLDPFSTRASLVQVVEQDELQGLHAQLRLNAIQAQQDFFHAEANVNIAYTILESSLGRLYELENALHTGSSVRVEPGMLLPAHKGMVSLGFSYELMDLSTLIATIQAEEMQLQQQVDEQYTYHLITRNCVTELLRSLNSAFENKNVGEKELGGWLAPNEGLAFVPHQFDVLIAERFPVQEKKVLPARRLRQLNALYTGAAHDNVLPTWLRESNTLSTTLYKHRAEDTHFLFFTDDVLLFRPVFGASNFLWGALNSVGGVIIFPLDGGERLHQGLRGMFYSLPELMFGNIRKGSYGFIETATIGP